MSSKKQPNVIKDNKDNKKMKETNNNDDNITLKLSLNNNEKPVTINSKSKLQNLKQQAAKEFKIDEKKLQVSYKGKVIDNDSTQIKEVIGSSTKNLKFIVEEKGSKNNKIKITEQTAIIKVENYNNRSEFISLSEEYLSSNGISKDKDYSLNVFSQYLSFEFKKVDKAHLYYQYINTLRNKDYVFKSIKASLYFGKTQSKEYEYPSVPDKNVNNSYDLEKNKNKYEKIMKEKTENENNLDKIPFSRTHKQIIEKIKLGKTSKSSNNFSNKKITNISNNTNNTKNKETSDKKTSFKDTNKKISTKDTDKKASVKDIKKIKDTSKNAVGNKNIQAAQDSNGDIEKINNDNTRSSNNLLNSLKLNIFHHLEIPNNLLDSTSRKKEFMIRKQQEKLDSIGLKMCNISSPYMSQEERRLFEEGLNKEKWISKEHFKRISARKIPMIPNYVNASPSAPPGNYKFRDVKKESWLNEKGFKVSVKKKNKGDFVFLYNNK